MSDLHINLLFPHQLFADHPLLHNGHANYLVEEHLFFRQYQFHKQKIAFHRASMKYYQQYLKGRGLKVHYIESMDPLADIRLFEQEIADRGITHIHCIDPTDDWLEQRLRKVAVTCALHIEQNPIFLNSSNDLKSFFRPEKKSFHQTTFYKQQRKKRRVLVDEEQNPVGGKWTYDVDNRKKFPRGKQPPTVIWPDLSDYWEDACSYTEQYYGENPGHLANQRLYPITHEEANEWFQQFLERRFHEFGPYEDAIVKEHSLLYHSLLSPLINVGLILPQDALDRLLTFAEQENVPLNSTEGLVRQIIGWREFIRGMYQCKGRYSRTRNFWGFKRKIPESFYEGRTGIEPIDQTIRKVLETGYCHHIERLMVLGNFMLLCEFDPDEVYRWFMELFIDAYDWVMVPNVYGMCLFADGGTFATKPYIGGSNYIMKMSNYSKGDWQVIWDALFWRFIHQHQDFFRSNPRTSMLVHTYSKMSEDKIKGHLEKANAFLESL
jgi:deoxyribodipyrimidine photolyase-related protein